MLLFSKLHSISGPTSPLANSCTDYDKSTPQTAMTQNKIQSKQWRKQIMSSYKIFGLQFTVTIVQSVLRQVHSLFQSQFSTKYDPVLPLPHSTIYTFTHRIFERKTTQLHLTNGEKFV
jgi:hypothetical protein